MVYQRHYWRDYDESKTETQNIEDGAVITTEKLNEIENGIVMNYTSLDIKKSDKTYVDSMLSSIAQGGPRELFYSLAALKAKYPTGNIGTYLVFDSSTTDGAHSYIWDATSNIWKDLGIYQGIEIADESVTGQKLKLPYSLLPETPVFVIGNPKEDGTIGLAANRITTARTLVNGERVVTSNPNLQLSLFYWNADGNFVKNTAWFSNYIDIESGYLYKIVIRKNDDSSFGGSLELALNSVYVRSKSNALSEEESFVKFVSKIDHEPQYFDFVLGQVTSAGSSIPSNRCRTRTYHKAEQGATAKVLDQLTTDFSWVKVSSDGSYISSSGWVKTATLDEGYYYFNQRYTSNAAVTDFDYFKNNFLLDNHNSIVTQRSLANFISSKKYVSPTGSDSNSGNSPSNAYATFQKAIDEGAKVILAKRGKYYNQKIVADGIESLEIRPYEKDTYDISSHADVSKIEIINGSFFSGVLENGLYKIAFGGNNRFKQVFTDKTLSPDSGGSRPSYNAGLWQNSSIPNNTSALRPVLTLQEVENTKGTFFWDGTNVYVNPKQDSGLVGFTIHNDTETGIDIQNIKSLKMNDVSVSYSYNRNMKLWNIQDVILQNCEAMFTMLSDSISLDYSSGNLYRCISNYARNDGFNMHYFGDTHFWNCEGHYNGDDGISHHEGCTGSITSGRWSHNGKGGVSSPTYGSIVSVIGNYCHDNPYGIYAGSTADYPTREIMVFDNVCKNNTQNDIQVTGNYTLLGKGNVYTTINDSSKYIKLD